VTQKQPKNTKNAFFGYYWATVGGPYGLSYINVLQGPIHEILAEIAQLLAKLKKSVFLSRPF
jgi:hypothetical protein